MFVPKKYIFETQQTKFRRFLANSFIIFVILIIGYSSLCGFLIYFSKKQNQLSSNPLGRTPPDLVAIFTGDGGRITDGLNILRSNSFTQLFITGVYNRNTINSLLKASKTPPLNDKELARIEIDYLARNTVENVISTLLYLRKQKQFKKIQIISSDYHLARIQLILNKVKSQEDLEFNFQLRGRPSNYKQLRTYKILYREVYKLIKTFAFLLLWDNEVPVTIVHNLSD